MDDTTESPGRKTAPTGKPARDNLYSRPQDGRGAQIHADREAQLAESVSPGSQPRFGGVGENQFVKADGDRSEADQHEQAGDNDIPAVLDVAWKERFRQLFVKEFQPVGPTEFTLTCDLARHAAGIEKWDQGGDAVERHAARHLPELTKGTDLGGKAADDGVLAAALSIEAADRCERHSLLRSRAFLRTLEKLEAIQAARRNREGQGAIMPPLGFVDEGACERYLAERLRRGLVRCPKCGDTNGCVIATRKCWECRGCKIQSGLRANTVMARSPVSLRPWFDAIRLLLWRPTIGAAELAKKIGIQRIPTVRTMARKIRAALAADDVSERLAGLDLHFASNSPT